MKFRRAMAAVLSCAIAALSLASVTSCDSGKDKNPASKDSYTIGICQLVQHPALDAATEGFKAALIEKLGEDKVTFDYQNASNDSTVCATIANKFVSSNVDLIMTNATAALQASMAATADIPIVATSITDYATALDISDWKGTTGINVTGTSDLAPLDKQAEMVKELVPDAKKVGILYCSGEANSKYQATVVGSHFDTLGLKHEDYTFADSNDISMVVTKACKECDVLYIPTDNTAANNAELINNIAAPAGIPIVAGEEGICKGCGMATLSISYYSIGYNAGLMAYDILVNGKNPAEMEIQYATDLTNKYVASRCEALKITVPDGYEAIDETAE